MFSRSSSRLGWVGSQPSACRVRALDEGWSVEDRAERAEVLLRYRLDREAEPAADDRGDVTHGVALVGHGVPGGAGRRLLQGQPEQHGRVERVHGRPALGAVARIAGHSGAACDVGQQAGESALALVVDRARQAHGRAPDPARGQVQDRRDRAAATADRPVGRQRVGLGGGAAWDTRRTRDGDEGAAAADELPRRGRRGRHSPRRRPAARASGLLKSLAKARWITPSAFGGAGAKRVQVGEVRRGRLGAGRSAASRGRVGAGEGEDGVAVAEQFGDDGGADQAGATGDEDAHGLSSQVMGLLSHHHSE